MNIEEIVAEETRERIRSNMEKSLMEDIYTTGNAKEYAQRQIMGEDPEEILQSFRERKAEATLDQVRESTEISWIKSIGECEAFIMASMFQQHVHLTRVQSIILEHLNASVLGNLNAHLLADIRVNYDYASALVVAHEKRMDAFQQACQTRRDG